jgi:biotin transport system substrate-specific component
MNVRKAMESHATGIRFLAAAQETLKILAFTALTGIGAQIVIPHSPVPFTLQTFFVLLSGALLGSSKGTISQVLYLVLGLAGFPLFTSGGFGLERIIGPTGGYLIAFPIAALIVGAMVQFKKTLIWTVFSMFLGLCIIFGSGIMFLNLFWLHDFAQSVSSGLLLFTWWDLVKLFGAASISFEISKRRAKQ